MFSRILGTVFQTSETESTVSDEALLQAMLDFEGALARAEARAGIIPSDAADAISACCRAELLDPATVGAGAAKGGNPAIPLVKQLTAVVPDSAAGYVHWGATSQDVIDTALMLVAQRTLPTVLADLGRVESACDRLARDHAWTVMAGRTLMQQALPVTFGLKAAGWLAQVRRVRADVEAVRARDLVVQFGGAAGTLASLGDKGAVVPGLLAEELGLGEPEIPWHTARDRFVRLTAALGLVGGAVGKIAMDVILLSQTELGEVREPRPGGSSTMPHKRNPVGSVMALGAVERLNELAGGAFGSMLQAHERAAGAWHAEWERLGEALRLSATAVRHVRDVLMGLEVDPERMRANLFATNGLIMAEAVMMALARHVGRAEAHKLVESACRQAVDQDQSLEQILSHSQEITRYFNAEDLREALDPLRYLGATQAFIDNVINARQG